jgi:L-alanine-DL-glutamate epimerase-like enolase superfamily enzyme
MAAGGLLPILERAAATRIETIVTTTVDSAVGVRAACHVAAALGNDFAHGLATSDWLKEDFLPPPRISAGLLFLPDRAGLGIDIDIQPS